MDQYFTTDNGEQSGPYDEDVLIDWIKKGELDRNTFCWKEGMQEWKPLHEVIKLSSVPPPPPVGSISGTSRKSPPPAPSTANSRSATYTDISQVPWLRRSNSCNILILATVLTLGLFPGILVIAVVLMTGDVYFKDLGDDGTLKKWGSANKVVAYLIVAIWAFYFLSGFLG